MFRTKTWIPVEIDPKDDVLYSKREDAAKEKAQLEEMQPENKYEIEEVGKSEQLDTEMEESIKDEYWKKRYEKLLELIDGVEYGVQQWQEIVEEHLEKGKVRKDDNKERD